MKRSPIVKSLGCIALSTVILNSALNESNMLKEQYISRQQTKNK